MKTMKTVLAILLVAVFLGAIECRTRTSPLLAKMMRTGDSEKMDEEIQLVKRNETKDVDEYCHGKLCWGEYCCTGHYDWYCCQFDAFPVICASSYEYC